MGKKLINYSNKFDKEIYYTHIEYAYFVFEYVLLTSFEQIASIDEEIKGSSLWQLDSLSNDVIKVVG